MKKLLFPGAVLKEQRELLGCSLQQVSQEIHVPIEYIEAFESGRIDKSPGRAYALGFLRSYCSFLNLDPEPFCDKYLLCDSNLKVNSPFQRGEGFNKSKAVDMARSRRLNELINWGTVCAFLLLGWLAYTTIIQPIADSWKSRVEAGAEAIEAPIHFNEEL